MIGDFYILKKCSTTNTGAEFTMSSVSGTPTAAESLAAYNSLAVALQVGDVIDTGTQCYEYIGTQNTVAPNNMFIDAVVWDTFPIDSGPNACNICLGTTGCTDPLSTNYDSNAVIDDGSCSVLVHLYKLCGSSNLAKMILSDGMSVEAGSLEIYTLGGMPSVGQYIFLYGPSGPGCYEFMGTTQYLPNMGIADHTINTTGGWLYMEVYGPFADCNSCTAPTPILGCTDPTADNYDASANQDDGSCTYAIDGCTDPLADNYDSLATVDDGSCTYIVSGCTDPEATNYDPSATVDDDSCKYGEYEVTGEYKKCDRHEFSDSCNDDCEAYVADCNIICKDEKPCPGCTDPLAINYNPIYTEDDGSCILCYTLMASPVHANCSTNLVQNGVIVLNPQGGYPPYDFDWTGPNGFTSTSEDLTGLEQGTYTVIITDSEKCEYTVPVIISSEMFWSWSCDNSPWPGYSNIYSQLEYILEVHAPSGNSNNLVTQCDCKKTYNPGTSWSDGTTFLNHFTQVTLPTEDITDYKIETNQQVSCDAQAWLTGYIIGQIGVVNSITGTVIFSATTWIDTINYLQTIDPLITVTDTVNSLNTGTLAAVNLNVAFVSLQDTTDLVDMECCSDVVYKECHYRLSNMMFYETRDECHNSTTCSDSDWMCVDTSDDCWNRHYRGHIDNDGVGVTDYNVVTNPYVGNASVHFSAHKFRLITADPLLQTCEAPDGNWWAYVASVDVLAAGSVVNNFLNYGTMYNWLVATYPAYTATLPNQDTLAELETLLVAESITFTPLIESCVCDGITDKCIKLPRCYETTMHSEDDCIASAACNEGCTDYDAVNFSYYASVDDGSCIIEGCMDATACNYDPNANFDDGSCEWASCFSCNSGDATYTTDSCSTKTLTHSAISNYYTHLTYIAYPANGIQASNYDLWKFNSANTSPVNPCSTQRGSYKWFRGTRVNLHYWAPGIVTYNWADQILDIATTYGVPVNTTMTLLEVEYMLIPYGLHIEIVTATDCLCTGEIIPTGCYVNPGVGTQTLTDCNTACLWTSDVLNVGMTAEIDCFQGTNGSLSLSPSYTATPNIDFYVSSHLSSNYFAQEGLFTGTLNTTNTLSDTNKRVHYIDYNNWVGGARWVYPSAPDPIMPYQLGGTGIYANTYLPMYTTDASSAGASDGSACVSLCGGAYLNPVQGNGCCGAGDTVTIEWTDGLGVATIITYPSNTGSACIYNLPVGNIIASATCNGLCTATTGVWDWATSGIVIGSYNNISYPGVLGCIMANACNYTPWATVDDGSCIYGGCGCTDASADNYNPAANPLCTTCGPGSVCIYCASVDPLAISLYSLTHESTLGAGDGSVTVNVSGGSGSYTYLWSNGSTNDDSGAVTTGAITLTATDTLCGTTITQQWIITSYN